MKNDSNRVYTITFSSSSFLLSFFFSLSFFLFTIFTRNLFVEYEYIYIYLFYFDDCTTRLHKSNRTFTFDPRTHVDLDLIASILHHIHLSFFFIFFFLFPFSPFICTFFRTILKDTLPLHLRTRSFSRSHGRSDH